MYNCITCHYDYWGNERCEICNIGLYSRSGVCFSCEGCSNTNCGNSTTSNIECDGCIDGYVFNYNCEKCNDKCKTCNPTNTNNCTSCYYDQSVSNDNCTYCFGCTNHCIDGYKCASCDGNQYIDSDGFCTKNCDVSCNGCTNSGTNNCVNCADNYYKLSGFCMKCGSPNVCTTCSNSVCTSCQSGYYLFNGICNYCGDHCVNSTCQVDTGCSNCERGYYFNSNQCNTCVDHCNLDYCYDTRGCTQCVGGYYLSNGVCNICINNCATCTTSS
ncbi:hypothetical protein EIN_041290, partial [Entamoeba invadens IP1]